MLQHAHNSILPSAAVKVNCSSSKKIKLCLKLKISSSIALATFQVLNSYIWLVATMLA